MHSTNVSTSMTSIVQPAENRTRSPDELPQELFHLVMSTFSLKELWKLQGVRKQWKIRMEDNKLLWANIDSTIFKSPFQYEGVQQLWWLASSREGLHAPLIKSARLGFKVATREEHLNCRLMFRRYLSHWPNLQTLSINGALADELKWGLPSNSLRYLEVHGDTLGREGMAIALQLNPNLEELRLIDWRPVAESNGVAEVACWRKGVHAKLKKLVVDFSNSSSPQSIDWLNIESLANAVPTIETLQIISPHLWDTTASNHSQFSAENMTNLRTAVLCRIQLPPSNLVNGEVIGGERSSAWIPELPVSLETLQVTHGSDGLDWGLAPSWSYSLPVAPNLLHLTIDFDFEYVSDSFMFDFIKRSRCKLERLCIAGMGENSWHIHRFAQPAVRAMANTWVSRLVIRLARAGHLSQLTELLIVANDDVYRRTDVGKTLARFCPKLVKLTWKGPLGMDKPTIDALAALTAKNAPDKFGGFDPSGAIRGVPDPRHAVAAPVPH